MSEDAKGIIHLQLLYDPIAGILNVKLIDAQDLHPRDFSGTADPYAKIRLLPDKANVWQTRIHKRTLNPSACLFNIPITNSPNNPAIVTD